MKLTKKQQIYRLKKMFGSKADLIDFESEVDGRLNYEENKRKITRKFKSIKSKPQKETFRGSPTALFNKAQNIFKSRSRRSKAIDGSRTAVKTFNHKILKQSQFDRWRKNPNKYDITNVDNKGSYYYEKPKKIIKRKNIDFDDIL